MKGVPRMWVLESEDGEKAGCVLHCGGWCLVGFALALAEWKGDGAAGAAVSAASEEGVGCVPKAVAVPKGGTI
jgi:hypothetical protein